MNIVDTIVAISKDPNQKVFWKDEKSGKSGVSYSGFHMLTEKGKKDGGRFDDDKYNRFIDLRITIFGEGTDHEGLKSLEKIMVKEGRLQIRREKQTNKIYHDLTVNKWERYDGRSNTKDQDEDVTSPAAAPAPVAAPKSNPFKK